MVLDCKSIFCFAKYLSVKLRYDIFVHVLVYFFQVVSIIAIAFGTLCFALTWQFNQFVLLLQAMALYGTQVLGFVPPHKVCLQNL